MDAKATAWGYLRAQREAVLWKVEGLPERDQRMPLTPTGTNLLGVVKHLAGCEAEYFGVCLGRPWPEPMAFWADDAEPNADMWATQDESPGEVLDLYRRVTAFADETIGPLSPDAPASVPWWRTPETDLHSLLVHMAVETARHAGHLDILREQVDGRSGLREAGTNLPDVDTAWWQAYVERLRGIAERSG
ncbi:MAG TPA: DinB family protein [Ornithinibacter sp.]|nr:DinB family protein [Ornithinibacter sp.]